MRYLILFLAVAPFAFAHNEDPEDSTHGLHCQPLKITGTPFGKCHDQWWDCRKEVDLLQHSYIDCVGAVNGYLDSCGYPEITGDPGVKGYEVPPHPIESAIGDINNCNAHNEACKATKEIFIQHVAGCANTRAIVRQIAKKCRKR